MPVPLHLPSLTAFAGNEAHYVLEDLRGDLSGRENLGLHDAFLYKSAIGLLIICAAHFPNLNAA